MEENNIHKPAPAMIDIPMATDFIETLTGSRDTPVTFQVFDDSDAKRKHMARIYHGTLATHQKALRRANDLGGGVFVTINETDGTGRAARNILGLRALFVDSDNGPLPAELPLQENIRVTSARGEHAYWLLQPGERVDRFTAAQKALIVDLGTDDSIHDRSRVMRLPGFLHRKGTPFLVSFAKTEAPRRSIDEVMAAFPGESEVLLEKRREPLTAEVTENASVDDPTTRGDWQDADIAVVTERARKYLANVPGAVEGEGGDRHTFKVACGLTRDFALPDEVALELLTEWNAKCLPPWEVSDLTAKLENARKYGTREPGCLRDILPGVPFPPAPPETPPDREAEDAAGAPPVLPAGANDNEDVITLGASNGDTDTMYGDGSETLDDEAYLQSLIDLDGNPPEEVAPEESKYVHVKVRDAVPGADVNAALVVPYGYKLTTQKGRGLLLDGACQKKKKKKGKDDDDEDGPEDTPLAGFPIIIKSRLVNVTDGKVRYELACLIGKEWLHHVMERDRALNTRHVIELAAFDFPVNSTNAFHIVEYLSRFDDENRWAIPTRRCTEQMGWHKTGEHHVFVAGNTCYRATPKVTQVTFVDASEGDAHLAKCIRSAGTLELQLEAMAMVAKYPRVELAMYAALATPLMRLVGAPSFAIDWCGESSTGKTTTMKVATSMWGEPNERARYSLIHSWNTTQVGLERLASTLNDLPLFMDETKQAPPGPKGRCIVPECIYQVTNGQGRARGAVQGRRKTLYWNTLLLTTGERPAVDHSKDAGPAARILTLWGSPFGGYSEDVLKIEAMLAANYGHVGPLFVQWLVEQRAARQGEWREQYSRLVCQFKTDLAENVEGTVADRLAKYLALLDLTNRLLREAIGLPWPSDSCVDSVLPDVAKGAAPFDRPLEALKHCFGVAVAEKSTFFHCHDGNKPPPRFNGYWRVLQRQGPDGTYDDWDFVGFMPDYLERLLRTAGFDVEPTLKLWHQRGWLVANSKEHRTHMVRLNGERPRVYAVKRDAIERALAG